MRSPAPDFRMAVDHLADRVVVHPQGDLDVAGSGRFRARIGDLIDAGTRHLVVNLAGVAFIDSAGLGVLIGAMKRLQSLDGCLTIVSPSRGVRKALEITGLAGLVEVR